MEQALRAELVNAAAAHADELKEAIASKNEDDDCR